VSIAFDTNVLLSGIFTRGLCEALVHACFGNDACVVVLSEHMLNELMRHAAGKFGVPRGELREVAPFLRSEAEFVDPADVPADSCNDPDDLPALGTALAGRADCLVTGNRELLTLRSFQGAPILSSRSRYRHLG